MTCSLLMDGWNPPLPGQRRFSTAERARCIDENQFEPAL